eukprot:gene5840-6125_t
MPASSTCPSPSTNMPVSKRVSMPVSKRVANAKSSKFHENVHKRGIVPDPALKKKDKIGVYPEDHGDVAALNVTRQKKWISQSKPYLLGMMANILDGKNDTHVIVMDITVVDKKPYMRENEAIMHASRYFFKFFVITEPLTSIAQSNPWLHRQLVQGVQKTKELHHLHPGGKKGIYGLVVLNCDKEWKLHMRVVPLGSHDTIAHLPLDRILQLLNEGKT